MKEEIVLLIGNNSYNGFTDDNGDIPVDIELLVSEDTGLEYVHLTIDIDTIIIANDYSTNSIPNISITGPDKIIYVDRFIEECIISLKQGEDIIVNLKEEAFSTIIE